MQQIMSRDNQYLRLLRSLAQKKYRQEQGCLLAEGLRLAEEAVRFARCRVLVFSEDALANERMAALAAAAEAAGALTLSAPEALVRAAASTEHAQGVLAAVELPALAPFAPGNNWYVYADRLADPGNLGTIMRTAQAAGCGGLLLSAAAVDAFNPKAVRASMGAVFKLPLYRCADDADALAELRRLNAPPLVASADGQDVRGLSAELAAPHTWVLGAEADGPSACWQNERRVSLPMADTAESLNVAAAAAVLFYQSFFARELG